MPAQPTPSIGDSPVAPGGTRLIDSQAGYADVLYTSRRETDVRTALARGLKEYMEQLATVFNGMPYAFEVVKQTWGEPEELAKYPGAIVYATGAGAYDASKFTPMVNSTRRIALPDGRYVVSPAEFVQDLAVEVWATSPEERQALVQMMEDALNPSTFRYGVLLELPHYHSERATYEMMTMAYEDTEIDAKRRYRKAMFAVTGRVPLVRLFSIPTAKPRSVVEVDGLG